MLSNVISVTFASLNLLLWNVKKNKIKKIVIVHTPAVKREYAVIVSLIIENWDNYLHVIFLMKLKERTIDPLKSF